ncbi:lipopolysaccharide biosynthesis protein [Methylophaga sp.]|jgi:O-antigen/teichoic acid export membrane protein|uniref:lipopolysaccharide biosynthesis protein n=1 Tax=Methylophaga sp. TaxID=2024840 RepID=UPI003F726985
MTMRRNLLAGLANSIWAALIGLAVVPFYLKYLGVEAYGLIGFFVTTQALFQLLDMGMAPTINREVARASASGSLKEAGKLLHTLAVIYWSMAAGIAILIWMLAPVISEQWLQSKQLTKETITYAVMLMGVVIACRWPIGLYMGALVGAQKMTVSSSINMAMITVASAGAVAILAFVSPTIEAFFIWQAFVGLIYALIMRLAAWRILGKTQKYNFDIDKLRNVWRFTAGLSLIAITAVIFTQMDKVILSKMLNLEEFGHYMLATVVVSSLFTLITPIFNIIYPRFSVLVANGETEKLIHLYRMGTRLLASAIFPIAMILVLLGNELMLIWTNDSTIASSVAPLIAVLAAGSALHGLMHFPYALQLAYGETRLPLSINITLMVAFLPLIIFLALTYGALGGALALLILYMMYMLLGTYLTHRRLLKGIGAAWLLQDVSIPLMLSLLIGSLGYLTFVSGEHSIFIKLLFGSLLALITIVVSIATSKQLRTLIRGNLKWNMSKTY